MRFKRSHHEILPLSLTLGLVLALSGLAMGQATSPPPSVDKVFTNSIGMKFRLIPAGSFLMGSTDADLERVWSDFKRTTGEDFPSALKGFLDWEKPRHRVEITKSFYLGLHEVTVDEFRKFVEATGYKTTAEEKGDGGAYKDGKWLDVKGANWRDPFGDKVGVRSKGSHPVTQVSWDDAQAFIRWLNGKEGTDKYRLPTEAEWEYACRGGREGELYPWGNEIPPSRKVANLCDESARRKYNFKHYVREYDDGYADTAPVGSFQANGFGLHDMIGNVWEWCEDWFGIDYYAQSPSGDPSGPSSDVGRVVRGGAWGSDPNLRDSPRSASRSGRFPGLRSHFLGFRLAKVAP